MISLGANRSSELDTEIVGIIGTCSIHILRSSIDTPEIKLFAIHLKFLIKIKSLRMEQTPSPQNSTSKNSINFSAKNKPINFSNFQGVNPAKSLHSPNSNTLMSSLKGKTQDCLKRSTQAKLQSLKVNYFNPESHIDIFQPNSARTMKQKKGSGGDDQPIFQFKPRERTTKRIEGKKMDFLNVALDACIERKHSNNYNFRASGPAKPIAESLSTRDTVREESSPSEYGLEMGKQLYFKKNSISDRSDSHSKLKIKPVNQPSSGPLCLDDFFIGKKLGKGKFGQVFLVKHKRVGLICAMKVLQKQVIRQNNLQNQLARQIMIQLYLSHPYIVQMYGMFTQNDKVYLLLEPCLDGHLLQELKKKRRFTEDEAADVLREVLEGLDIMHRCSIIHRDLKPQNICRHEGVSKIGDFGWAVYSPDSLRGTFCGTPLYMSPELLIGKQYTESVDIWAIGMLAYELLIGRLPFKVQKPEQLAKIITDQVEFPQHIELHDSTKNFVMMLLEKDPKERFDIQTLLCHDFLNRNEE